MASVFSARFALRAGNIIFRPNQRWMVLTTALTRFSTGEGAAKFDRDYFDKLVKDKSLVLFMKGEPSAPMCGFSRLVVQILAMRGVENYSSHDVLEDVEFKEGMKEYSQWPTFPQVYIKGELVGGADIMLQLHQSGELGNMLIDAGLVKDTTDTSNKQT